MAEKVFHFIYVSFASEDFDFSKDIDDILEKSRTNNEALNITGTLLKRGGIFLQLLEGNKELVLKLYEKIEEDPRHRNSKILVQTEDNTRIFPQWTMSYKTLEDSDLEALRDILPWNELISSAKAGGYVSEDRVLKIVKKFATDI